ncbi:MAG: cyclic nucleotide-binding domain-containing protein [Planctomycetes bacterium]|nr:cyclic nucleotide-binding domain-containing protein [Planctomycetota bacterium]
MIHEALPEIPVFHSLTQKQIAELNGWLTRKDFAEGETLVREGSPPDGMFVIARGKVAALKATPGGEVAIATIEGPSVLGEMGLLTGESRSASAVARTQVATGHLPIDLFEQKIAEDNLTALHISYNLGCIVSQRLRQALLRIAELTAAVEKCSPTEASHKHVTKVLGSVYSQVLLGKED